jgi:ABC-type Fe3+ transport system permease subunit/DNA-binding beta-propeller fold protein YncE
MNWALLSNSLGFAGLAAALALGFGLTAALCLASLPRRLQALGVGLAAIALALPPFVVTNCWLDLLGQTGRWRAWVPIPLFDLRTAAVLMALMLWPIPMLAAVGAWQRLEPAHLELDPRLTGGRLLRHLLLPAAWPALALATALTLVLALANFALPAILQVKVYTVEIWLRFSTNFDLAGAFAASLPVVVAPLLLWLVLQRAEVTWPRWQGAVTPTLLRQRLGWVVLLPAGVLTCGVMLLSTGLPLGQVLTERRTWSELGPALAAGGMAVWNSAWLAAVTATLVVGIGLAGWRWRWGAALWLPFLFPGVFVGVVLIWLLNRGPLVGFYQSAGVAVLALGLRYLGPGWHTAALARQTADRDLVDAARLAGGSRWTVFRLAIWPSLGRPLFAAWYVVYLLCLWDVETLVLIIPPGLETLALRVFNLLHYGHNPQVNALCLLLLGLALLPLALWLAGRGLLTWARRQPDGPAPDEPAHPGGARRRPNQPTPGAFRVSAVALTAVALLLTGCTERSDGAAPLDSRWFSRVEILGTRGRGPGQFNKPRSVAVDRDDNLYVVDMTGRVQKFAPDGRYLLAWQMPETDLGRAKGLGVDLAGRIMVVEPHYSRVNHFTPDGTLALQWGTHGTNVGQLTLPRAVASNRRGEIWTCEYTGAERVQRFSPDGTACLAAFGRFGSAPGEFNRAEGLCVDAQDRLYVADSCNHRIQVFDAAGRWLRTYGRAGAGPGALSYPYDIRVDAEGTQFVCEFGNSRIQVFDAEDRPVEIIGRAGAAPGQFSNPWGLALDSRGNLYVADAGNHRVQKLIRRTPLRTSPSAPSSAVHHSRLSATCSPSRPPVAPPHPCPLTSDFGLRTSDFGLRTSNLGLRTSPFELRPSPFELRPSPFELRPSNFALRTSPFGLRTSPFELRTSPFGLQTSPLALRPPPLFP